MRSDVCRYLEWKALEGLFVLDGAAAAAGGGGGGGGGGGDDDDDDAANGVSAPRGTVAWSAEVRCEVGRRCYAQYGDDADELWFRATVAAVCSRAR